MQKRKESNASDREVPGAHHLYVDVKHLPLKRIAPLPVTKDMEFINLAPVTTTTKTLPLKKTSPKSLITIKDRQAALDKAKELVFRQQKKDE